MIKTNNLINLKTKFFKLKQNKDQLPTKVYIEELLLIRSKILEISQNKLSPKEERAFKKLKAILTA